MSLEFPRHSLLLEELLIAKPVGAHLQDRSTTNANELRSSPWSPFVKIAVTFLSFLAVFMEHFFSFKFLRDKPLYLGAHWLTSVVYVILFHLVVRSRPGFSHNVDEESQRSFFRRLSVLTFYIITLYIKETDLATQVNTQGPSAFLVNLCLSPLIITAAITCLMEKRPASWVSALMVAYSGMMLMTVCSDVGSCYTSFKDAAFNVAFTAVYGIYFVKLAQTLTELSVAYTLFLLNTLSVVLVPGLIVFSPEGLLIWKDPSILIQFLTPTVVVPLVLLKLLQMITTLLHIKVTSVTSHVMTRNLAWIPTCLVFALVFKIELMVSSFKAYWIVGASYMLYIVPDDTRGHDFKPTTTSQ